MDSSKLVRRFLFGSIGLLGATVLITNLLLVREVRQLRLRAAGEAQKEVIERPRGLVGSDLLGRRTPVRFGPERGALLITFSADCQFCRNSLPNWTRVLKALDRDRWDVYWISRDPSEVTAPFVTDNGISELVLADVSHGTYGQLGLASVPKTIVVSSEGVLLGSINGELNDKKLPQLTELLR